MSTRECLRRNGARKGLRLNRRAFLGLLGAAAAGEVGRRYFDMGASWAKHESGLFLRAGDVIEIQGYSVPVDGRGYAVPRRWVLTGTVTSDTETSMLLPGVPGVRLHIQRVNVLKPVRISPAMQVRIHA